MVSASLVTAIMVMSIAWFVAPSRPATGITRFSVPLPEQQTFTATGRNVIAISPDGTRVAYVANSRLHLRSMDNLESRAIAGADLGSVINPVFSPDGQSVAFWSQTDGTLRRVPVSGGAAATLAEILNPFGMSWSPGAILVGQGYKGILRVNENGGATQIVQVADGELAYGPQLLPDGDTILFTVTKGTAQDRWEKAQVVAQSVKSRKRTLIVSPGSDARYLSTGHLVYALAGSILAAPFDLRTLTVTSRAVPVLVGVRRSGASTAAAQFAVSDTGSLVYIPGPTTSVLTLRTVVIAGRTSGTTPLALPAAPYTHPRVSSDGTRMVFSRNDAGGSDIWKYELAGTSAPQRLTFDGHSRLPIWAGDSNRVLFQSDRDGARGIYLLSVDGSRSDRAHHYGAGRRIAHARVVLGCRRAAAVFGGEEFDLDALDDEHDRSQSGALQSRADARSNRSRVFTRRPVGCVCVE